MATKTGKNAEKPIIASITAKQVKKKIISKRIVKKLGKKAEKSEVMASSVKPAQPVQKGKSVSKAAGQACKSEKLSKVKKSEKIETPVDIQQRYIKEAKGTNNKGVFGSDSDIIRPLPVSSRSKLESQSLPELTFGIDDGKKTLIGKLGTILRITDLGKPQYSALDWNLIVKEIEVISLDDMAGKTISFPEQMSRGILVGPDGSRLDFANMDKLTVAKASSKSPNTKDTRHLYLMGLPSPALGWVVVIESSKVINLADIDDFIVLNPENSGILIGPEGAVLDFSKISSIKLDLV